MICVWRLESYHGNQALYFNLSWTLLIVDRLIDVANNAPSGGNIQPISIIIVENNKNKQILSELVGRQPWVKNAPMSMIFCIDFCRVKRWAKQNEAEFKGEESFSHFMIAYADLMCAAQNIVILAEHYGLGTVYVGSVLESINETRSHFAIPEYVLPVMVLSIGYPKGKNTNIPKLKSNDIVHYEKYTSLSDKEINDIYKNKYGDFDGVSKEYLKKAYVEVVEAEQQGIKDSVEMASEKVKNMAISNNAQFLFKLRYPAEIMVKLNKKLYESFMKAGFKYFGNSK